MTLATTQIVGTFEKPVGIIGGPEKMELMLALFDSKEVYFIIERRRGKVLVGISMLRSHYSDGSYWGIEGMIMNHGKPLTSVPFTADYLIQGGKRTGTLLTG